jgi:hypothetical protein
MNKLAYFSGSNLETISESPNKIIKKGLVLIEGTHVDSKKRTHTFSPARIREIVSNSNALFANTRIPVLMDHKKEQSSVIGDVESQFQCTTINESNFPGADDKGLTGKLGIFVNQIAIKSGEAIRQLNEGLLNTLSPGIDVVSNAIREISATPNPAIANLRLFKRAEFESDALTFDDLENSDDMLDKIRNQYEDLTNKLWELTETIQTIDEQALNGQSREEVQYQAINDFATRFLTLIGSGEEEQDPMMQEANGGAYPNQTTSNQVQGGQQNWGMPPNNPNARYASGLPIAAFSMAEMEAVNRAEFGLIDGAKSVASRIGKDLKQTSNAYQLGKTGSAIKRVGGTVNNGSFKIKNKVSREANNKILKPTLSDKAKGIGRAANRFRKTKTGKGLAIGTGALVGTGLAVGAYRGLSGKKQTVVNNYN